MYSACDQSSSVGGSRLPDVLFESGARISSPTDSWGAVIFAFPNSFERKLRICYLRLLIPRSH